MRILTATRQFITGSLLAFLLSVFAPAAALAQLPPTPNTAPGGAGLWCVYTQGDSNDIKQGCFTSVSECRSKGSGCTTDPCPSNRTCTCGADTSGKCPKPAVPGTNPNAELKDPLGNASIPTIVARFTNILLGLSGSIALLMFVYAGFQMITAGGDDKKYAAGKNTLRWAVTGLIVIFGAYAFLSYFLNTIGTAAA